MDLYTLRDGRLTTIPLSPFAFEKELQKLIEGNSDVLFGVEFIKSEMTVGENRIDTLCFDLKTKSFVIIEYKRGRNRSILEQGWTYLSLLRKRPADFILSYHQTKNASIQKDDVNWNKSRLIFVSTDFTKKQMTATEDMDEVELWKVLRYSGDILGLMNVHDPNRRESPGNNVSAPRRPEVEVFGEEHHKKPNLRPGVWDVYERLRDRVLAWEGVEMSSNKHWITFRRKRSQAPAGSGSRAFLSLGTQNSAVWGTIGKKKHGLDDPRGIAEDVSGKGGHGTGDYRFKIHPGDDLDYVAELVHQSYRRR